MKASKYMISLALIHILKKKQRTRLSLIAVMLSTAVIFASVTLLNNVNQLQDLTNLKIPNFHYMIEVDEIGDVPSRYQYTVEKQSHLTLLGYEVKMLEVKEDILPFVLLEGRLPEKSEEYLVSESFVGENVNIVGIYRNNDLFQDIHQGKEVVYTYDEHAVMERLYVKDKQVYDQLSFDTVTRQFGVSSVKVFTHNELVSVEAIRAYMNEPELIETFYMIMVALCVVMSFISILNVLLISDPSRKKEIGLLKSVGAGPKDIALLLHVELFVLGSIGAFLGIILGFGISYFILMQFIQQLFITFSWKMVSHPIIILLSFLYGVGIIYFSGIVTYAKYLKSKPIEDLSDQVDHFLPPKKVKQVTTQSFGWKMFMIYNRRMKKYTKNILTSFTLLLMTTVLFLTVVFSNMTFRNRNIDVDYDIKVQSLYYTNPKVSYGFYDLMEQGAIDVKNLEITRVLSNSFRTNPLSYDQWFGIDYYKIDHPILPYSEATDVMGDIWCNVYHYATAFDQKELEKIRPYVVEGSIDNLTEQDVVAVFRESMMGSLFCNNFHVGDTVAYYPLQDNVDAPISTQALKRDYGKKIAAIVHIPENKVKDLGYPFNTHERMMALSLESLNGFLLSDTIAFRLKNLGSSISTQLTIENMLMELESFGTYEVTNTVIEVENNRFASFIIEVLLYPLFFLLFVVSLMNIHHVLSGNLLLKQRDIAMMKSIGLPKKSLKWMLVFEYMDAYLTSCMYTAVLLIPIEFWLYKKLMGFEDFYLADHLLGAYIFSCSFLAILLLVGIVVNNIKKFQKIRPLDV